MTETRDEGTASLARSGAVMAAGTMASRVLGMVKGSFVTAILGGGLLASTFDVANTLPNNLYLLIAGGVLNAVLVPQIARAASHADGGEEFVNRLLTLSIVLMAAATVVATAAAPLLIRLFADHQWSDAAIGLATSFAYICLPQIFFYGLYTLLGQVLNARGRFGAYMWAPAFANIVTMGGLLLFLQRGHPRQPRIAEWTPEMIWIIAGAATLGIVVQALVLVVPLRRMGFRFRPVWGFRGVGLGRSSKIAGWTFAALAVSQLGFVLTSRVLTRADAVADALRVQATGKVPYSNAFLLFMLPHSLITVSLVTALFTRMSHAAHRGEDRAVVADLGRGLRTCAVLLVPMTVGGILLAPLVTRSIFLGNSSTTTDAFAKVLIAMLVGLLPYGWLYLVQRVFYAYEDARTPFRLQVVVTVVASAVNVGCFLLPPEWVGVGVGVGQSLSNLVAALLGFHLLRRRLGPLRLQATVQQNARMLAASLAAAAAAVLGYALLAHFIGMSRGATMVTLAVVGAGYLLLTLVIAARLRVPEIADLVAPVTRRVGLRRG